MRIRNTVLIVSLFFLSSCSSFYRVLNYTPSQKVHEIEFSNEKSTQDFSFHYSDTLNNDYLKTLRQDYGLDTLTSALPNEFEKIKTILHWSSQQWKHNGSNTPSKSDALTILEEAKQGKQFRCVEYGIVAATSLNSLGIHARVLGLKTRDVKKIKYGAGHVVSEVYSKDYSKWVFIDPQFNIMPTLNGIPLNTVEFQSAILNNKDKIVLINSKGPVGQDLSDFYLKWIGKYLYFIDFAFDQRVGSNVAKVTYEGKSSLMLVPLGEDNPTIFQRKYKIDSCIYTHSINDFYAQPNE